MTRLYNRWFKLILVKTTSPLPPFSWPVQLPAATILGSSDFVSEIMQSLASFTSQQANAHCCMERLIWGRNSVCTPRFLYPLAHGWATRLFLYLGYWCCSEHWSVDMSSIHPSLNELLWRYTQKRIWSHGDFICDLCATFQDGLTYVPTVSVQQVSFVCVFSRLLTLFQQDSNGVWQWPAVF